MVEVPFHFVDGEIVCDSDDPDALLRDAKKYRRTGKQMLRRVRSGTLARNKDAVEQSFASLAEACERRAAQLKVARDKTSD